MPLLGNFSSIHLQPITSSYHLLNSIPYLGCLDPLDYTLQVHSYGVSVSLSSPLHRHGISSPPHSADKADLFSLPCLSVPNPEILKVLPLSASPSHWLPVSSFTNQNQLRAEFLSFFCVDTLISGFREMQLASVYKQLQNAL